MRLMDASHGQRSIQPDTDTRVDCVQNCTPSRIIPALWALPGRQSTGANRRKYERITNIEMRQAIQAIAKPISPARQKVVRIMLVTLGRNSTGRT